MTEKPGGWLGAYYQTPKIDKKNGDLRREKSTDWRIGHTVKEVEELLKKEKEKNKPYR